MFIIYLYALFRLILICLVFLFIHIYADVYLLHINSCFVIYLVIFYLYIYIYILYIK